MKKNIIFSLYHFNFRQGTDGQNVHSDSHNHGWTWNFSSVLFGCKYCKWFWNIFASNTSRWGIVVFVLKTHHMAVVFGICCYLLFAHSIIPNILSQYTLKRSIQMNLERKKEKFSWCVFVTSRIPGVFTCICKWVCKWDSERKWK